MKTYKQFIENIEHQAGSDTTQVATTTGTYKKTAIKLKALLSEKSKVLDYGSGLGKGTEAMEAVLGPDGHTVDSYEPAPDRAKSSPTFTNSAQIKPGTYNAIVSHNVLNVLEPDLRNRVMKHILSSLAVGGHAIIGVRKFKGDVDQAKNATPGDEKGSLNITKKMKGGKTQVVYQKGFDGDELKSYVQSIAGGNYKVERISGIAANAVHITRIK